jgi:hypothetical protein
MNRCGPPSSKNELLLSHRSGRFRLAVLGALLVSLLVPLMAAPATLTRAVGPVDANHGFPIWYEDDNGTRLELCLDANGLCLDTPPDPTQPPRVAATGSNFPDEAFWWAAEATIDRPIQGRALLVLALEAAFLNETPAPGDQITFGRVRVRIDHLRPFAVYTVTHPYGVDTLVADGVGVINVTEDIGCAASPCDFAAALQSRPIASFLRWDPSVPPAAPAGFLGDPAIEHTVVGSPNATNFFRIEGPDAGGPGVNVAQSDLFSVQGKLLGAPAPNAPLLTVDPAGLAFGNVNVGATSAAQTFTLTNSGSADLTIGTVVVEGANAGDFAMPAASDTCSGATIVVGGGCVIGVTFSPTAAGTRNAHLVVPSNAVGNPHLLAVGGTGVDPNAPPRQRAVGPVSPDHGFPLWYQDDAGLRLALCLDPGGLCLDTPPDPTRPPVISDTEVNFPDEAFWWAGEAAIDRPVGTRALLVLAMEAAFLNEVAAPGDQMTFGRVRIRIDGLQPGATYTVTHPYGVETFEANDLGVINFTEDIGCVAGPCDFSLALDSRPPLGFLKWDPAVAPAAPAGFIGDPMIEHRVVGSPFDTNVFRIDGPAVGGPGVNMVETDLFSIMGKLFQDAAPGGGPALGLSATSLAFGEVNVGATSATQTLTLTNTGTAELTVNSIAVDPASTSPGDFAVTGSTCFAGPVPAGSTCTAGVTFTPSAAGTRAARLLIDSNAPGSPHAVTLGGTGIDVTAPPPAGRAVGPVDPAHGFPRWYRDDNGTQLDLCLDANGLCLDAPPDPTRPATVSASGSNFPDEAFWWAGEAAIERAVGGRALLVLALEAAFLNEAPAPGDQITFGRVRIRIDNLRPGATYTITHPYGVETLTANDLGVINFTEDIGCEVAPCDFAAALTSRPIASFLRWDPSVAPAAPAGFIGDPAVEHTVVGSPNGTNVFRIVGPDAGGPGVNSVETDLFAIQGKLSGAPAGTPTPAGLAAPSTPDLDAASDTGTSNTDEVTTDATPTFTGTAPAGSTVDLLVDGAVTGSTTATGGTWSITSSTLEPGVHVVGARATSGATSSPSMDALDIVILEPPPPPPPVRLLGNDAIEASVDFNPAGLAEAFRTTASTTGTVSTLRVYVDAGSTATTLIAGLYANNVGHPGALLGRGTLTAPTAGVWNSVSLTTGVPVTSGTVYWIALLGPAGSGTLRFRDRCCGGGSPAETSAQTGLGNLPANWSTGTSYRDGPVSAAGFGEAGGSPPPPPPPTPPPAPTVLFGNQTIEPSVDFNPAGMAEAFRTTATASGSLTALRVFVDATSTATTLVAGLYADAGGHPGARLAQGTLTTITNDALNTVPVPATAVTAGTTYWIAILGPSGSGTLRFRDRCCGGGSAAETSAGTTLTTLPATWATGAVFSDGPLSAFGIG